MQLDKSPTFYKLMESYLKAVSQGSLQASHREIADSNGYEQLEVVDTFKIFQDIVITAQGFYKDLSIDELKMVIIISDELFMNNALWYHKPKNSRAYDTIRRLIIRDLLRKTEDPYIFVVNPQFIRRGTIPSVLAQTMRHLSTKSRVDKSLIHDLRYKKVEISQYDKLLSQ